MNRCSKDFMTIFEKILNKEISTEFVYEDEKVIAFNDIAPQAKTHLLFIHKEKSENVNDLMDKNAEQVKDLYQAIQKHTRKIGLDKTGFRVVTNLGSDGGQTVFYTHFHVLGGEQLGSFGRP